ncbi:hypothetical protein TNCV_916631 [Trichonephila clavipes]|nr:hypothetical protein TNCV_916631 [Trichonephila clavipes]
MFVAMVAERCHGYEILACVVKSRFRNLELLKTRINWLMHINSTEAQLYGINPMCVVGKLEEGRANSAILLVITVV